MYRLSLQDRLDILEFELNEISDKSFIEQIDYVRSTLFEPLKEKRTWYQVMGDLQFMSGLYASIEADTVSNYIDYFVMFADRKAKTPVFPVTGGW